MQNLNPGEQSSVDKKGREQVSSRGKRRKLP
jgi:hypothetical protein